MKGIILAGGYGTRLFPATLALSKQLLPVFDKPMIYYPLSILMQAGLTEIMVISTPHDLPLFERLLGNGKQFGVSFTYRAQEEPRGLAHAFIIAQDFINNEPVCLVLGDNIFFGSGFSSLLQNAAKLTYGAQIFGYQVISPQRYGVLSFDSNDEPIAIQEKPNTPKSNWAVTGLYFYDHNVCNLANQLKPSSRGELEITDLNQLYMEKKSLKLEKLGEGYTWLDTGTYESLHAASSFVQALQARTGKLLGAPEQIALDQGWVHAQDLKKSVSNYPKTGYRRALLKYLKHASFE